MRFLFIFTICFTIAFLGCKKEEDPPPEPDPCQNVNSSFESQILPIFTTSCALSGCHDDVAEEGDNVFDTYENIKASIEDDPEQFLMSINFEGGSTGWMPRDDPDENADEENKLPASQIMQIECWMERGMPND